MFLKEILFYLLFIYSIDSQLQLNLYLTDWVSNDENNYDLQHDCLYVVVPTVGFSSVGQIISYCMSTWPSKWNIKENNFSEKFTFDQLSNLNISSQQLYAWSAPMDLIEKYQFYLNQPSNSKNISMTKQIFYNCTLPYFGPKCQYVLFAFNSDSFSLESLVQDFYYKNGYEPTTLTCYIHLQCNRGLPPSCLDWSEICDGKIDCLDNGEDEEHCWQLEIHECSESEYRCSNGQCIDESFVNDYIFDDTFDCLDRSDLPLQKATYLAPDNIYYFMREPTFITEDVSCVGTGKTSLKPLTSSCVSQRRYLLLLAMFSAKPKDLSNECWTAFKCIIHMPISQDPLCEKLCYDGICDQIILSNCPDIIPASAVPILFGRIYLAYDKNNLKYRSYNTYEPTYFCYHGKLIFLSNDNETRLLFNNHTCHLYRNFISYAVIDQFQSIMGYIDVLNQILHRLTSWVSNDSIYCNQSSMYQCMKSNKCISKSRLFDNFQDCYYHDDENISIWNKNCSIKRNILQYKCHTTNECIPFRFFNDGICHCTEYGYGTCDDERYDYYAIRTEINFATICDNLTHLYPMTINGQSYTDETECDYWQCNNIYTRCDDFWNCLNGADELNCHPLPSLNCPSNNHICMSIETKNLRCLPIEKANDGNIDCIGAADEPTLCRGDEHRNVFSTFYCKSNLNETCFPAHILCNNHTVCTNEEDEQACTNIDFEIYHYSMGICQGQYELYGSDVAKTYCRVFYPKERLLNQRFFKLGEIEKVSKVTPIQRSSLIVARQSIISNVEWYQQRCHRGLDLQVWLDKEKNLTTNACFCPPSFYGDICQFQNQRVSVSMNIYPTSDSILIPFAIIVSLIDDSEERIIHSYEQFTFLLKLHCLKKFHAYLLYSTRPKNSTKQYSIHIDIYEKNSLKYRASIIKPLLFSFLPIHRLSFTLNIPRIGDHIYNCSDQKCIHGQCKRYSNNTNNETFCQCNKGWSGRYCTIEYTCNCSSDSLCIGRSSNNRSICVCPLNKMGPRCLLNNSLCQNDQDNKCLNGGQCTIIDEYKTINNHFACICPKNFTGDRCQTPLTKLIIKFGEDIFVPRSIRIHFIEVYPVMSPNFQITAKRIPLGQRSTIIYWAPLFHIVFIEWPQSTNYYLTILQGEYNQSGIIEKTLHSSDRCLNINELFNETIVNDHLIRRIKYYHIPCRTNISPLLPCFYDNDHFCICQNHFGGRVANCLKFNYHQNTNCNNQNGCENGGICFESKIDGKCADSTICECPPCFYGERCEINTNIFSLSLDVILSYHIQFNVNISHQSTAVIFSLILSIIIVFIGIMNGIASVITFKDKKTRDVGCGIYLLCSSINTLLIMIIFTLKILILFLSQIGSIKNESFLKFQCISIEFILRFGLTMDQWLTTCVTIERVYITIKGINFNKKKIKSRAKWIIFILILIIIATSIHDPFYRRLFYEEIDEQKRIWCISNYSYSIHIYNIIITSFHIILPFIINLISAIIIIIINTKQRSKVQEKQTYKHILNIQIRQHKHLVIGPIVLIILAIPRLIISFTSGCMKSNSDSWLFILGYFISLIPPLLTFILFILPSTIYYKSFQQTLTHYRNIICRCS